MGDGELQTEIRYSVPSERFVEQITRGIVIVCLSSFICR